ncbi:hypothetical protein [Acinetobacter sp. ANC 4641]|uniref:hypothetical protein n=1 Tax=Acinetobacter sp. ANC 4641 TaxID=2529847 RepID=UPI0010404F82|nr:hypothetical protein [Acinetobacter sp. ANC 4641]TCB12687.1 hypothetical protein E0H78_05760 [Acinetobacter sp. ANC 4641]
MDKDLYLSLKAEVHKRISHFIEDGYSLIGDIFMTLDEETGVAEVDVFLINIYNSSLPLEKYYRYQLLINEMQHFWVYLDNND